MDKKFRFDFKTTQAIITKVGHIDSFKGKWNSLSRADSRYLQELKKIATIQSIGSSTRIEGATLSDEEVATLIENLQVNKLESQDEQEAIGYYEVLELILEDYPRVELSERNVFNLHSLLLKFSHKDHSHRGQYKQVSNQVVATYPGGEQRIIFRTTEPFLVGKEMEELIAWYRRTLQQKAMHPLLCIGGLVYEFLTIHPFQDGNGRLSRLLTSLLLLQNGYDFIQYISLEHEIENTKKQYYQALMAAQQHRYTDEEVIDQWILFFLNSLETLIYKLDEKVEQLQSMGPYLNDRQKAILSTLQAEQPLKVGDLAARLPNYTIYAIRKDLEYLLSEQAIRRMGKGKGTVYFLPPEKE